MLRKIILLMFAVPLLSGFTSVSDQLKEQLKILPQHYSHFDVKMGWAVKAGHDSTSIEGVIQNVRYAQMENIEIWVSSLDANGKTIGRAMDFVIPRRLDMDDLTSFCVRLPVSVMPGTKLMFTYKYDGLDGEGADGMGGGGGAHWMQSFESDVPPRI